MTHRLLVLVALAAFVAPTASAQYAGAFARMGVGARAAAMGGGQTADVFGGASAYFNPALAPFAPAQAFELTAGLLSFDRQLQHLQFSTPLRPRAGIAGGVLHAGVSDIDGRDGSGYHTEDYSTDEYGFFVAFGTRMSDRLSAGLGLRFYRNDLFEGVDAAQTLGLSLGLAARLSESVALGLAVDDLLARYAWDTSEIGGGTTTDRFPIRVRVGAAAQLLQGRLTVTAEAEGQMRQAETRTTTVEPVSGTPVVTTTTEDLTLAGAQVRVGGEYWLVEPFGVRVGYDRLGDGSFGEAAPSAGFALRQRVGTLQARLDYAAIYEAAAGAAVHLVTLRVEL
ncbi:MAG TPA: PorV/PorQ family protein [Rubricoccaceae bacterium]|nr:PorV/PorQ family protein [Rubricoccaceae bacterium]